MSNISAPPIASPRSATEGASEEQLLLRFIKEHTVHNESNPKSEARFECNFRADRINHILIFSGSFNPPHVGHLTFLQDAFEDAGGLDMHFACAIITPVSDQYLRGQKFKNTTNPLILPYVVRCQLWLQDHRFPPWAALFEDPSSKGKAKSLADLKDLAWSLGFRIKYSLLRSVEGGFELSVDSLGLVGCFDNVLIYIYGDGERNESSITYPMFQAHPWHSLPVTGGDIELYQTALSSRILEVRGFVRVAWAHGKRRFEISSTEIRMKASLENNSKWESGLRAGVLSWDILKHDPSWKSWSHC